jgi:hypothetical protein
VDSTASRETSRGQYFIKGNQHFSGQYFIKVLHQGKPAEDSTASRETSRGQYFIKGNQHFSGQYCII